jgi:adenine-specific DNA-methyltransferase
MTISDIRNILEAPYNRKVWKSYIQTQFTNNNLLANDAPLNLGKSDLYTDCYSLGNYAIDDYTIIGIFEIQLADKVNLTRNRVALRNLIKSITQQVAGAMVVFVQGDKWRFSYISKRKVRNKETNTVEDKETAPKRYTYLFGKGEKALTASIRFDRLIQKQQGNLYQFLTLNDFEEAFSVEKLSKEFFAQYKEIYDDFVEFITGKRYIKKGSKWVETPTHEAHFQLRNYFNKDEKQARDFFKRMMGRIVFLYFIQKKGWLSVPKTKQWGEGNPDYLFELYKNAKYKDSFYSEYLVPLFFDTLNNVDVQKESNEFRFPYLNGGLFDKAQDFKYDKIALPSEIFDKLFTTFNNYNFTIYEDAPDEHTVAVDPEMLGHIFENLLEDNKDKGAFYTPKDIVHYMCRESLHNYIYTYTGNDDNEDFKAKLKQYNENFDIRIFEKDEIKLIDRALEDVKICDPAIGSGAFPMGLLHEIYHLKIPIEDSKGMKAKSPADLKKHIIEESIYGVDIDSGAVDIARLRFWLSLVVDEVAPQPLPNLAFKIVCANTLIPLGKPKSDLSGSLDIAKAIEKLRHSYFDASKEDKKDLERQFKNLQNKLWATAKDWVSKEDKDIYLKISEFNPFEDKSCTWFDAWWMFGVKDGFDIVIGNPPYVSVKGITEEDKTILIKTYKTAIGQFDLYGLFIEKSFELLKQNSIFSMITSSTFLNNKDFYQLRKKILNDSSILSIANLDETIFESAQVDVAILIFKTRSSKENIIKIFQDKNKFLQNEYELIEQEQFINEKLLFEFKLNCTKQDFILIDEIFKDKIPLSDILLLPRGIELGSNSDLIETAQNKNNLKLLVGRDIKRFQINFENRYIVFNETDKSNFKDKVIYTQEKLLIQRIRNLSLSQRIVSTIDKEGYLCTNTLRIGILKNNTFSLKFILGIINSKLINYVFLKYFLNKDIYAYQLEQIPIVKTNKVLIFETLVDYLLYLHNKETPQILSHTDNTLIASHLEDILNMMVYELYFSAHMKEVGIDVLQFINPKPINTLKSNAAKAEVIQEFYEWYQQPDNAVRQRMLLVDTRSKDIIGLINKSL